MIGGRSPGPARGRTSRWPPCSCGRGSLAERVQAAQIKVAEARAAKLQLERKILERRYILRAEVEAGRQARNRVLKAGVLLFVLGLAAARKGRRYGGGCIHGNGSVTPRG